MESLSVICLRCCFKMMVNRCANFCGPLLFSLFFGAMLALPPVVFGATSNGLPAWRVGLGTAAFQMSSNYPASPYTFRKHLLGYQVNLGYMISPAVEGGLLVTGGGKATDSRGGTSVELKLPILPQAYLRTRQHIGGHWGLYEMVSFGFLKKEARNISGATVLSEKTAVLGVGAGVSWQGKSPDWQVDLGALMPSVALKHSSVLNTRIYGVVLALNYAFGQNEETISSDETISHRSDVAVKTMPVAEPQVLPISKPLLANNATDKAPTSPKKSSTSAPPTKPIDKLVAVSHFRSGHTDIDAKTQRELLQLVARTLRMKGIQSIAVRGYADAEPIGGYSGHKHQSIHNFKSQKALSYARAQAIAFFLIKHGIDKSRIMVDGYGATGFVADNATVSGRNKNRRVEVHFMLNGRTK